MAFVTSLPLARPQPPLGPPPAAAAAAPPRMSARPAVSRRALLSGAAAALSAAALAAAAPGGARAAGAPGIEGRLSKVLFPKAGYNAPDAMAPGSVTVDAAVLGSAAGKAAVAKLAAFGAAVKRAGAEFEAAPTTADVAAAFRAIKVDELRSVLNVLGEAFDEEAQKTTDKVVRGIIQDVGELVYNGGLKGAAQRTPRKVDRIRGWVRKIDGDFDYLLAFYK